MRRHPKTRRAPACPGDRSWPARGAGAAGLAMSGLVAAPALAARRTSLAAAAAHGEAGPDGEAFVVHLRDIRSGEMDVYRGTSHVRVTDRSVAAALARASRQQATR